MRDARHRVAFDRLAPAVARALREVETTGADRDTALAVVAEALEAHLGHRLGERAAAAKRPDRAIEALLVASGERVDHYARGTLRWFRKPAAFRRAASVRLTRGTGAEDAPGSAPRPANGDEAVPAPRTRWTDGDAGGGA